MEDRPVKFSYVAAAVAIAFSLSLTTPGLTESKDSDSIPHLSGAQVEDADQSVTGMVQKVETAEDSLKIEDKDGEVRTVTVDSESRILRNGKTIDWDVIKRGDVVTILNPKSIM
jgi:hypothetical protein